MILDNNEMSDNKYWTFMPGNKFIQYFNRCHYYDNINYWITRFPDGDIENAFQQIRTALSNSVKRRVTTSDRPIACLLSGGLDSSLITALVAKHYSKEQLETYSIGMPGSEDLKFSQIVADHLGTKHTQIVLSEDDFFNAIPKVIYSIESYDTTTVRASVGNYLVSKYIAEHSNAKVIFNGDGSDEVTGGYMYFHKAPTEQEFDTECHRRLDDIYTFDVLRSDKSIASNGLEPRTPFLDKEFVNAYLSIPITWRYHPGNKQCEKYMLRKAFDGTGLLPDSVLWRTKEAFSDGVSSHSKSWFEIIDEKIDAVHGNAYKMGVYNSERFSTNTPKTQEQNYYRDIFEKYYCGCGEILPYFWMPKYVNATDSSARTLNVYAEKQNED
jgi:asparagine synthase (glutamine-hydrolysing)